MQFITLYYQQGSSDKVYRASLEKADGGYVVNFAYGRRGSTLVTGSKTSQPVPLDDAQRIYDKLVREKTAKGYTPGHGIAAYRSASHQPTGILPQLLNAAENHLTLMHDDAYLLQEKHDGRRILLRKRDGELTAINRRGLETGIPGGIVASAFAFADDFLIDGEAVGETLYVFDLLEHNGKCLRAEPYSARLEALASLRTTQMQRGIVSVISAHGTRRKLELFSGLLQSGAEGVVFKRTDAPYTPGRPASGGPQLKYKFVKSASVLVAGINNRRSAAIAVLDKGRQLPCGNVTIPPNHPMPQPGQVVEVRYLYAMPGSRALYQPVFLGVRDDILPGECTVDQLQFRREPASTDDSDINEPEQDLVSCGQSKGG